MNKTRVVTRFAPSPTGDLHIGGARTALFNWLFARHHGGTFLLRIEDTDRARSTPAATQAILDGLAWLGLDCDGEPISQFARAERHAEVARALLARGKAYKCFASQDEIAAFREAAKAEGRSTLYRSPWRDADPATHPDAPFVIRIMAPREGETVIADRVQGEVRFANAELDDMILLRSDGTPTYMHAVVVDDHDMGVTHVIRGDDHLANAARQTMIYDAMGWDVPIWAHIPLIHGPDGKKLSKRHGALSVTEYRDMGYPAPAMRNYLARLGWSHGDDEIFTTDQAIAWFGLEAIKKAPARLDFDKLAHVSGAHIAAMSDRELADTMAGFAVTAIGRALSADDQTALVDAAYCLKDRAKSLHELFDKAYFLLGSRPFTPDENASKALDTVSIGILKKLTLHLQNATWSRDGLEVAAKEFAEAEGIKLGKIAQPLRAALTGRTVSPSVFDIMPLIGKEETLARIADATG